MAWTMRTAEAVRRIINPAAVHGDDVAPIQNPSHTACVTVARKPAGVVDGDGVNTEVRIGKPHIGL